MMSKRRRRILGRLEDGRIFIFTIRIIGREAIAIVKDANRFIFLGSTLSTLCSKNECNYWESHQERVATVIEESGIVLLVAFQIKVPGVVCIIRL